MKLAAKEFINVETYATGNDVNLEVLMPRNGTIVGVEMAIGVDATAGVGAELMCMVSVSDRVQTYVESNDTRSTGRFANWCSIIRRDAGMGVSLSPSCHFVPLHIPVRSNQMIYVCVHADANATLFGMVTIHLA